MSGHSGTYAVDKEAVRLLAHSLCSVAGKLLGDFCLASIRDTGRTSAKQTRHYPIPNGPDAEEQIVSVASQIGAEMFHNVYFAGALFRPGSIDPYTGKGRTEGNVVGVLCGVCEFDGKHDPATRDQRLPRPPCSELESSPGNFHCHYWFDRPYIGSEIKPVLVALAEITRADNCKSTEHLWRMPGTWNWPSAKKINEGRSPDPFQTRWSIVP